MDLEFTGKIFYWRGPSPYHYVAVPAEQSGDIKAIASLVTYGWGVIPVRARSAGQVTGWLRVFLLPRVPAAQCRR